MNTLAIGLFWCVAQVTLLSVVAGVLYCVLRRFGPALGATVSLTALVFMSAATISSLSPWPNWMPAIESRLTRAETIAEDDSAAGGPATVSPSNPASTTQNSNRDVATVSPTRAAVVAFWEQIRTAQVAAQAESSNWRWSSVLVFAVCIAVVLGLARLAVGLIAVRRYRQMSRPISEPAIHELLDVLAAQLGCVRHVELRESQILTGAATIGWRSPLILLPPAWRAWDERDRRAVLAHELAHIHHNDYLTWLAAQLGLALHFYHPLAHWLCGCLRLDQELVADSTAARLAGGEQSYLQSLAQIALQQSEPQVSWAARTFLPTRRTFLRRIEMLRDSKEWLSKPPRSLRWLAMTVLLVTGLVVLGLRGPVGLGPQTAHAQQPKPQTAVPAANQDAQEAFSLAHVPRDAFVVFALRPAALLKQPALQAIDKMIRNSETSEKDFGVLPDQIQTLHMVGLSMQENVKRNEPFAYIARCVDVTATQKLAASLGSEGMKEQYGTQEYFRLTNGTFRFQPDERTVVFARDEGIIRRCIIAGPNGAKSAKWAASWNEVAANDVAGLFDTAAIRPLLAKANQPPGPNDRPSAAHAFQLQFAPFAPLWEQCDIAVVGIQVRDTLSLKIVGKSASAEDAKRVHDTVKSAITLGQNMLGQARPAAANSRSPDSALMLGTIDIADQLLANVKLLQTDSQVTVTIEANAADTTQLVSMVVPAVMSARQAARLAQSMNNMKQIGLAFHNYHDAHQHLPPAVIYGPNNVPRSWRVELLPFLEASDLYNQYRQDEPWDSEHNKKLLEKIPPMYRDPADAANSVNTSCFVVTGPGTVFDRMAGTRFVEIADGASNTILAVQAKRAVPWTKPEDITFMPDKPVPKLGGWTRDSFVVALCDGSVRQLLTTIDERALRILIMIADGQPLPPLVKP
jgi:beta-lactamase regulating signal transducer with metallopeptidase domain